LNGAGTVLATPGGGKAESGTNVEDANRNDAAGPRRVPPAHANEGAAKEISISALSQSIDSSSVPPARSGVNGGIRRSASIDANALQEANELHGSAAGGWADANFAAEPQQIRANRRFRSVGGPWTGKRRTSRASIHNDVNWPRQPRDRGIPANLSGPEVAKLVRQPSINVGRASLDMDQQTRRFNPGFNQQRHVVASPAAGDLRF
jgi:hypothetical protein